PTAWLLNEIGINSGIEKLEQFGVEVAESDRHLGAIALGGMNSGTSPLEIASAYSTFANNGVRVAPHFITKIVDASGNVVVDNTNPESTRVLSEEITSDMNRLLLGVF
ncbi:penicillin-binding transpeptidase domain-containing protein, partial [Salmonella enterica]|uniref:penicillin-binding transpeptidase domain-containing protein n=1 Tax=Salmonella enterica TaxID=28901 RepID=UPI000CB127D1